MCSIPRKRVCKNKLDTRYMFISDSTLGHTLGRTVWITVRSTVIWSLQCNLPNPLSDEGIVTKGGLMIRVGEVICTYFALQCNEWWLSQDSIPRMGQQVVSATWKGMGICLPGCLSTLVWLYLPDYNLSSMMWSLFSPDCRYPRSTAASDSVRAVRCNGWSYVRLLPQLAHNGLSWLRPSFVLANDSYAV